MAVVEVLIVVVVEEAAVMVDAIVVGGHDLTVPTVENSSTSRSDVGI